MAEYCYFTDIVSYLFIAGESGTMAVHTFRHRYFYPAASIPRMYSYEHASTVLRTYCAV